MLKGCKPDLSNLRVWGCFAWAVVTNEKRPKLDQRAEECRFLGYAGDRKGCVLWRQRDNKISYSRDVYFNESRLHAPSPDTIYLSTVDDNIDQLANDDDPDPETYEEAMRRPDKDKWEAAIQEERASLEKHKTWNLVPLPGGRVAIGCRWVLRRKRNAKREVIRYKARLVALGYSQREGIDYNETFSPVVKMATIRLIIALAAILGLKTPSNGCQGLPSLNGDLEENHLHAATSRFSRWISSLPPSTIALRTENNPRAVGTLDFTNI